MDEKFQHSAPSVFVATFVHFVKPIPSEYQEKSNRICSATQDMNQRLTVNPDKIATEFNIGQLIEEV